MPQTLEQAAGQRLLLSFQGKTDVPPEVAAAIAQGQAGGVVLFRAKNMGTLEELRALTAALRKTAADAGQPPLLIAADQEGGQLMAIGDATPFPGNLALGATRSEKLAHRVGRALAREVAAVGVNVDFAPVCDVNINPANPVVGTRSFGEDPKLVGRLGAALARGLQAEGVCACAKHFPGHGDTASDSHDAAPVLRHDAKRIARVELPPFRAAIAAHVRMVMTAHIVLPALNGGANVPSTLSAPILRGLLRKKLGFKGVIVTDAMDMRALEQGPGYMVEAMAAMHAGADLLLFNHHPARLGPAHDAVVLAARRGLLSADDMQASAARVLALKKWLAKLKQPPLSVVACAEHRALAAEVAAKAVTLVRNGERRLPLRLASEAQVAVVIPRPEDLTPADTSSLVVPRLACAARRYHERVDEIMIAMNPDDGEVRAVAERLAQCDLAIVGTINATPGQAALVKALVAQGTPVVAVALRMPYDLASYPAVSTYACAYSILPPAMDALAAALWGKAGFPGRLPVSVPRTAIQ